MNTRVINDSVTANDSHGSLGTWRFFYRWQTCQHTYTDDRGHENNIGITHSNGMIGQQFYPAGAELIPFTPLQNPPVSAAPPINPGDDPKNLEEAARKLYDAFAAGLLVMGGSLSLISIITVTAASSPAVVITAMIVGLAGFGLGAGGAVGLPVYDDRYVLGSEVFNELLGLAARVNETAGPGVVGLAFTGAGLALKAYANDPPRPDYQEIELPVGVGALNLPLEGEPESIRVVLEAGFNVTESLQLARKSAERYQSAVSLEDWEWADTQRQFHNFWVMRANGHWEELRERYLVLIEDPSAFGDDTEKGVFSDVALSINNLFDSYTVKEITSILERLGWDLGVEEITAGASWWSAYSAGALEGKSVVKLLDETRRNFEGRLLERMDPRVRVTFSGLLWNRSTRTFDLIATLENVSSNDIHGEIRLVIDGVSPSSVGLANPDGVTEGGSPFVASANLVHGLAPAERLTLVLRFVNPERVPFTFTHFVARE